MMAVGWCQIFPSELSTFSCWYRREHFQTSFSPSLFSLIWTIPLKATNNIWEKYHLKQRIHDYARLSKLIIYHYRFNVLRDRTLQLTAQTSITMGEEITIQYMTPMLGNVQRKQKIKKNWYFDCSCPRCEDPTEKGTNVSGVLCSACLDVLLPR